MADVFVFTQVTIADVFAWAATQELDVDHFVEQLRPALGGSSGNRDVDFVRGLSLIRRERRRATELEDEAVASEREEQGEEEDGEEDVSDKVDRRWRTLRHELWHCPILAHGEYSRWVDAQTGLSKLPGRRYDRLIRPIGVRTLFTSFDKPSWDYRYMPSDSLGADRNEVQLLSALWDKIEKTTGGQEYLEPDPELRALAVLATTVAAVLSEQLATRSDPRARAKIVRPDIYEATISGMGLRSYFQTIREILEVDHPNHKPYVVSWPRPTDPPRDLGILEYRGQREPRLVLNARPFAKL